MTEFSRGHAIVIADLHLHLYKGESQDGGQDRLRDGLVVLDASLRAAQRHMCPWLNLGDNKMPRAHWPVEVLSGMLSVLRRYPGVKKLIVRGNHDGDSTHGSGLLPFAEVATIVDTPSVFSGFGELPPFAVWPHGGDWSEYPRFLKQAEQNKARLLLGHLFLLGAVLGPDEIRLPGAGTPVRQLGVSPEGPFVLGVFGDVHKAQTWHPKPPRWEPGLPLHAVDKWAGMALYPGSPYMQSWGERGDGTKGFLHLDLARGCVEQMPTEAPQFLLFDVSSAHGELLPPARTSVAGHFVRIRFPAWHAAADRERTLARLRGEAPRTLHAEVVPDDAETQARVPTMHAGQPLGDLLAEYVKARPLPKESGIRAAHLLAAGKKLLDGGA